MWLLGVLNQAPCTLGYRWQNSNDKLEAKPPLHSYNLSVEGRNRHNRKGKLHVGCQAPKGVLVEAAVSFLFHEVVFRQVFDTAQEALSLCSDSCWDTFGRFEAHNDLEK